MWSWLAIVLSGLLSVLGAKQFHHNQSFIFKLFSLFLLLVMVYTEVTYSVAALWIMSGIVAFMLADVAYNLQSRPWLPFVLLLIGQFCYSRSFWLQTSGDSAWWLLALLVAAAIVAFFLFLPQVETLVLPVIVMAVMSIQLAWAAGDLWLDISNFANSLGFLGVLALMISALVFAIHRYRRPIRTIHIWGLGGYFLAHSLIVASLIY